MARNKTRNSGTKVRSLEQRLGKQDVVLERHGQLLLEQKDATERLGKYVNELLTIIGGSASLDAPGMKSQLKDVVEKVKDVPAMKEQLGRTVRTVNEIDQIVQKMQSNKGKTVIVWADVRTKLMAILIGVSTFLSVAVAIKELFLK